MMKDLVINIFGSYEPIYTDVVTTDGAIQSVVASGAAGVDWVYVAGVAIFALTLFCVFRIIGSVIKNG